MGPTVSDPGRCCHSLRQEKGGERGGLEFVLAHSSESFSSSKLRCLFRFIRVTRTSFEDQRLFDGAFATKWVLTQGDVGTCSDGKREVGFVLCQRLKGGFERPGLLASLVGLFDG
jgi:hypothetical protein